MTTRPRRALRPALAALALGASTLSAAAQMDAFDPPPPPPDAPAHPDEMLRGPDVEPADAPGRRGAFGADDRGQGIQLMAVLREIRQLRGDDVPEEAQITRDQTREIMGISRAFQQDRQAYMRAHKAEFDELRAVLGDLAPERGPRDGEQDARPRPRRPRDAQQDDAPEGDRPQRRARPNPDDDRPAPQGERPARPGDERAPRADRPEPTPEQAEALKKWRELMSEGPSPEVSLAQVMDVLTPTQREVLGERLERRRRDAQREPREQRRRGEPRPAPGIDSVDVPRPAGG